MLQVGTTTLKDRWYYIHDAQGNVMATYKYSYVSANPANSRFHLLERPLYGSDRLGMDRRSIETTGMAGLFLNGNKPPPTGDAELNYELKDHLGNVATVVTGELISLDGTADTDTDADFKVPNVVSYSAFEPFGSLLPGRNYNSGSYRFAFQGQEHDDEVYGSTINPAPGTSYAFEYRMHDPRVGRFLSIDPLAAQYAHNSPYAFSENRVIDGVDYEGSEYLPYWELLSHRTPGDMTDAGVTGHNMIRKSYNTVAGLWNLGAGLVTGDNKMVPGVWQHQLDNAVCDAVSGTADAVLDPHVEDVENLGSGLILGGAAKLLAPLSKVPLRIVAAGDVAKAVSPVARSFADLAANPTAIWSKSADEVAQMLGDGWTKAPLNEGTGWKFIQDAGDGMVSFSEGTARHGNVPYYKISSGETGIQKVAGADYVGAPDEKATIHHVQ